jgi:DNA polymerase-3 subunit delta
MRATPEQLERQLARGLAPVYVVSGDEPLQSAEALDAIRAAARGAGCSERLVLDVDGTFDWTIFAHHAHSLSLFGERRILELRMPGGKPGAAGAAALTRYAEEPNPGDVLVVSCPRLDANALASRWYRALERAGVAVAVWPIPRRELPTWIGRRMVAVGLEPTAEAAAALAERVEGNLLACVQEIAKLHMLHGGGPVETEDVYAAVADSARFDVFDLVDSALAGHAARTVRITRTLREEGVEPLPVLGSLAWTIRSMAEMARGLEDGASLERLLERQRPWRRRQRMIERALGRHPPGAWWRMLRQAARVDRAIKGAGTDPWDALERLALAVCGVMIFEPSPYNGAATGGREVGG